MMIRVNLNLARKLKKKTGKAPIVLFIAIVVALAALGISLMAATACDDERANVESQIAKNQTEISAIKSRIADSQKMDKARLELVDRERTLARLASIRRGPQFVLNEFARLLSNPRDIVARKMASEEGWLLAWEPENIIIRTFKEVGNGEIQIDGTARAMDDVYEFWTRMKTSKLLRGVELVEIKGSREAGTGEQAQSFMFKMEANFNYNTKEGLALLDQITTEPQPEAAASPVMPKNLRRRTAAALPAGGAHRARRLLLSRREYGIMLSAAAAPKAYHIACL